MLTRRKLQNRSWHGRLARDPGEEHGRDARATSPHPALSPEYRGEGSECAFARWGNFGGVGVLAHHEGKWWASTPTLRGISNVF
jgi:hypothetical protein